MGSSGSKKATSSEDASRCRCRNNNSKCQTPSSSSSSSCLGLLGTHEPSHNHNRIPLLVGGEVEDGEEEKDLREGEGEGENEGEGEGEGEGEDENEDKQHNQQQQQQVLTEEDDCNSNDTTVILQQQQQQQQPSSISTHSQPGPGSRSRFSFIPSNFSFRLTRAASFGSSSTSQDPSPLPLPPSHHSTTPVHFSRTLSVGRLRDRVLRPAPPTPNSHLPSAHHLVEHTTDFLERRRRIRSQVRALQRLGSRFENLSGHERSCILTGQYRSGRCTCRSSNLTRNLDDDTSARASISRIVMLAETLFEVLDEIHQQSMVLSSSPFVSSLGSIPAPEEVVDSMPVKIYTKLQKHQFEDVSHCSSAVLDDIYCNKIGIGSLLTSFSSKSRTPLLFKANKDANNEYKKAECASVTEGL